MFFFFFFFISHFPSLFLEENKLTSLPSGLFDDSPLVTTFGSTFQSCNSLTGDIPAGLFDNNPLVTSFAYTFYACYELESAPSGLYANNTLARSFSHCMMRCYHLWVPGDLFGTDYENRFADLESPLIVEYIIYPQGSTYHSGGGWMGDTSNPCILPDIWDTEKWSYPSGCEPVVTSGANPGSALGNFAFYLYGPASAENWYEVPRNWGGSAPAEGMIQFYVTSDGVNPTTFTSSHLGSAVINWGDGTGTQSLVNGTNTHTYANAGMYRVYATCTTSTVIPYIHFSDLGASLNRVIYANGIVTNQTSNLTSVANWFQNCTNMTYVYPDILKGAVDITDVSGMFSGCSSLKEIPYKLFKNTARTATDNLSGITNFSSCFSGCSSLKTIPDGLFDICTNGTNFSGCFSMCSNLESAGGVFANTTVGTDYSLAFYGCPKLVLSSDMFGTSLGNRFASVSGSVNFDNCFSLGSESYAGSSVGTAPALWQAVYPNGNSHNQIFYGHSISSISNHVMAQAMGWA